MGFVGFGGVLLPPLLVVRPVAPGWVGALVDSWGFLEVLLSPHKFFGSSGHRSTRRHNHTSPSNTTSNKLSFRWSVTRACPEARVGGACCCCLLPLPVRDFNSDGFFEHTAPQRPSLSPSLSEEYLQISSLSQIPSLSKSEQTLVLVVTGLVMGFVGFGGVLL